MDILSAEAMMAKSPEELIAYNQSLMAEKDTIAAEQQKVKAEINSRVALSKYDAMPAAEKKAIAQHIQAGNMTTRT